MSDSSPPLPPQLQWELLDRYYAGEATPAESASIQAYFLEYPSQARVLEQLFRTVRRTPAGARSADVDRMLAAAHRRILPAAVLRRIVHTLFNGSVELAIAALLDLDDTEVGEEELARLHALIDQARREGR